MRRFLLTLGLISTVFLAYSQSVFINELHYDNNSGDVDEGVEVVFPSGVDIDCYQIEAYNGSGGGLYSTTGMPTSVFSDEGCGYDAIWVPISGLQNGAPDGIALVFEPSLTGCTMSGITTVVQFLSYEGSLTATSGSANGMTSTDIGVSEASTAAIGTTLQLTGTGTDYTDFSWNGSTTNSMGDINVGQDLCSGGAPNDVTGESMTPNDQQLSFSWNSPAGCSDEIMVVASTSSTFSNTPSGDGSAYVADANFGSGTDLGGGEYVVYKGSGTSFNLLSLTNDTEYCITIYNRCGTTWSTGVVICGTPDLFNTTLKVMAYNILNYPGSTGYRDTSFRKIVHYVDPDIIVVNELITSAGLSDLVNEVNTMGVSNYAAAPFNNGPDTDNGLIYKTDILTYNSQTHIATALRDITDYNLSWPNNSGGTTTFNVFSLHLKAGNTVTDETKRQAECQNLSTYLDAMAANSNIAVGGDFNFYDDTEPGLTELTSNGTQLLIDPINSIGGWHNDATYQNIHTQSTRSSTNPGGAGGATGGLDDRFDFVFINNIVQDGQNGVFYNGNYSVVGNDGNKFNVSIIENLPNTSVPDSIRDALFQMSDHLPILMEVRIDYQNPLALPVTLVDQHATRHKQDVEIEWSTASEVNASHYHIYRSADATNFDLIGTVSANGNSTSLINYSFIDEKPLSVKSYYKIVQFDFNGDFENFDILPVEEIKEMTELILYPNPSNQNEFHLKAWNFFKGMYSLSIFDITGKQIYYTEFEADSENFDKQIILPELPENVYTVVLNNEQLFFTEKWVKY